MRNNLLGKPDTRLGNFTRGARSGELGRARSCCRSLLPAHEARFHHATGALRSDHERKSDRACGLGAPASGLVRLPKRGIQRGVALA